MSLIGSLLDLQGGPARDARLFGVVIGVVTNNQDPDGLGRVKLHFPWLSATEESHWARIAVPMAGAQRGTYFLPEVDDEVLVAFEHGDLRLPYVLGALWNGQDAPPASNGDGKNNLRLIRSRSGHLIQLNDEDGKETVEIVDKTGKNRILIDTAANRITISAEQDVLIRAGGTLRLEGQEIQIESSGAAKLKSGAGLDVEAGATLNVKGATVNIN